MQAESVHPAKAVGRVAIVLALFCAAILGGASQAAAEPSPNIFLMKTQNLEITSSNSDVTFQGHGRFYLYTSNTEADRMRARVSGWISLNSPGCAQVRVEYLDGNGLEVAAEHSQTVENSSGESAVNRWVLEHSFSPDYRNVRIELLHGSNCSSLVEVGSQTTDAKLKMSTLGGGQRWVSGVREANVSIEYEGAKVEDLTIRMDIATNPAPTPDRGDVEITGTLSFSSDIFGCARLHAEYRDVNNVQIAASESDAICSSEDPAKIKMPNFASDTDLHSVRLRLESVTGGVSQMSPYKTFYLE